MTDVGRPPTVARVWSVPGDPGATPRSLSSSSRPPHLTQRMPGNKTTFQECSIAGAFSAESEASRHSVGSGKRLGSGGSIAERWGSAAYEIVQKVKNQFPPKRKIQADGNYSWDTIVHLHPFSYPARPYGPRNGPRGQGQARRAGGQAGWPRVARTRRFRSARDAGSCLLALPRPGCMGWVGV